MKKPSAEQTAEKESEDKLVLTECRLRELRDLVEKMTKAAEAIKLRFDTLVAALGPSAGLKD
jgi:hypothetical protein